MARLADTEMLPWSAAAKIMLIKKHRRIIMNPGWVKFQDSVDPGKNNLGLEMWSNEGERKGAPLKAYCSQRL